MHKKIAFILALMVFLSVPAFCATTSTFKYSIGLDNPFFGILQRDPNGNIVANIQAGVGVSLGLGIAYKRYFSTLKFNYNFDPTRTESFSPYWAIGTFALILPYVGIGADYAWTNGFYFGVGIMAISAIRYVGPGYDGYIGPEIHGGLMF